MSENKVAVITAGGRGMGAAIARELHGAGYDLALMSPSGSAEELAGELGGVGLTGSVMEPDDRIKGTPYLSPRIKGTPYLSQI